jgi:Flp pilus assembly pilin Flp
MKIRDLLTINIHSERGASMIEYILLMCGIALVAIMGVANIGSQMADTFDYAAQGAGGNFHP